MNVAPDPNQPGETDEREIEREEPPDHLADDYAFRVVEYADRPDECTICPRSISKEELLTTWITARHSESIDLHAHR